MRIPRHSKLGSILLSTMCLVAFALVAGPVIKPASSTAGIEVHPAARAEELPARLRVVAGKSFIMESSARILRASVADPDLARAVEIDDHELLLNGKAVGRTIVTVWQEGGAEKRFDLHIEQGQAGLPDADMRQDGGPALTAAYESAMARVETAITGVNR